MVSKTCGLKKKTRGLERKTRGFKKTLLRRLKTKKYTPDKLPTLAVMNVRFLICKMIIVMRKVMTYKVFHESINSD